LAAATAESVVSSVTAALPCECSKKVQKRGLLVENTRIRFVSVQGRCNRSTQPFRFKVAVTELERFGVDMAATGCGRDRNKVKFSKWDF
jgi:hypothetical protein